MLLITESNLLLYSLCHAEACNKFMRHLRVIRLGNTAFDTEVRMWIAVRQLSSHASTVLDHPMALILCPKF